MKKLITVVSLIGAIAFSSFAESTSTNINPGQFFPLMSLKNGSASVKQIIITSTTATNSIIWFMDTSTNLPYRIIPPYTNTVSFLTNQITSYTNYFNVVNTYTNLVQLDATNNLVPLATNAIQPTVIAGSAASASTSFGGVNYNFHTGCWITNAGSGAAAVTITFQ